MPVERSEMLSAADRERKEDRDPRMNERFFRQVQFYPEARYYELGFFHHDDLVPWYVSLIQVFKVTLLQ
jgi:hypothetical protein